MSRIFLLVSAILFSFFSNAQVVVYSDCNYGGRSASLGPGNYYTAAQFSMPDNNISSIIVPKGYRVEAYTRANMSGLVRVFTTNSACFNIIFNNQVSSIRITYNYDNPGDNTNPYGGISAYTECQYRGRNAFLPPGDYTNLNSVIGNNVISSLRVPEGMIVELYQEQNFRGATTGKISSDNNCLGSNWSNRASSAKVYYNNGGWIPPTQPPQGNEEILIYSGCNYYGQLTKFLDGDFRDLKTALARNPAGSIVIPTGTTVEFYSDLNFGGYLMGRYTSSQSCLQTTIQYNAESMRIYRTGGGGNTGTGATIFLGCNYTGTKRTMGVGSYNNLSAYGYFGPSSIRVAPGYEVTLYELPNLQGTTTGKINSDNQCLGSWIRGKAKSAVVTYNGGSGGWIEPPQDESVYIYTGCNYKGLNKSLSPGYYPRLTSVGQGDVTVYPSAIKVPAGYTVELYTGIAYTGSVYRVTSNMSCLPANWRSKARSIIVKRIVANIPL